MGSIGRWALRPAMDGVDVDADRENGATAIVGVAPAERRVFQVVKDFAASRISKEDRFLGTQPFLHCSGADQ